MSVSNFLRTARYRTMAKLTPCGRQEMKTSMENTRDLAERDANVGFSGGEKKRLEVPSDGAAQALLRRPRRDDQAARRRRCASSPRASTASHGETGCGMLITHYPPALHQAQPRSRVRRRPRRRPGGELADELEENGYDKYLGLCCP